MNSHGDLNVGNNRTTLDGGNNDKLVVLKTTCRSMENTRDKCAVLKNLKIRI